MDIKIKTSIRAASKTSFDRLWIAYSEYADGTDYITTWEEDYDFIGFAVSYLEPTSKDAYKWSRFIQPIDDELSDISKNPVQNKVINKAIVDIEDSIDVINQNINDLDERTIKTTGNQVIDGNLGVNELDAPIILSQGGRIIATTSSGHGGMLRGYSSSSQNRGIMVRVIDGSVDMPPYTNTSGKEVINIRKNQLSCFIPIYMGSERQKIINLGDPEDEYDATNKKYVDDKDSDTLTSANQNIVTKISEHNQSDVAHNDIRQSISNHIADKNNPHGVTAEQTGAYYEGNQPPYPVTSVNNKTGAVTLDKSDVGLSNVDNTSDLDKPLSTAETNALALKADKNNPILIGTAKLTGALDLEIPSALGAGSGLQIYSNDTEQGIVLKRGRNSTNAIVQVYPYSLGASIKHYKYNSSTQSYDDNEILDITDSIVSFSVPISMGSGYNKIINLGTPSNNFDAANKKYVDDSIIFLRNEVINLIIDGGNL